MSGKWAVWFLALVLIAGLVSCNRGPSIEELDVPSQFSVSATNDYPAVAKIILPAGRGLCTGAFISPRAVLTAAHCTQESGTYRVVTSFGTFTANGVRNFGSGDVEDPNDISVLYFSSAVADPSAGYTIPLGNPVQSLDRVRLVGFGCSDLDSRLGSGVKRTGTNQVYQLSEYIELVTPRTSTSSNSSNVHALVGPDNRAGSCFGDSGSPLLKQTSRYWEVVGVGHAGSWDDELLFSYFADLGRSDNSSFLASLDSELSLGMLNPCGGSGTRPSFCEPESAASGIISFLKRVWSWFIALIF